MGFDNFITPYASARGEDILLGVNYASAAAGIREETGRQLVIFSHYLISRYEHSVISKRLFVCGFLSETSCFYQGGRIAFAGQVANHVNTVSQVVNILGDQNQASSYLSKCIYSIGLGSNDYLNNYFMPTFYSTGNQFTPDSFADDLVARYTEQLKVSTLSLSSTSSVSSIVLLCFFTL